jgi:hypothetical protein
MKEVTTQDIRKEMLGLDPITKKNLLGHVQGKSNPEILNFIKHYKKVRGLDTREGVEKYQENRKYGCKGCKNKR